MQVFNFYGLTVLKFKPSNVGSCNKMFGSAMYFVAWYTLPFFRELNLFFINLKFCICLSSRMPRESGYRNLPAPG
jgi:hypothetical protein